MKQPGYYSFSETKEMTLIQQFYLAFEHYQWSIINLLFTFIHQILLYFEM